VKQLISDLLTYPVSELTAENARGARVLRVSTFQISHGQDAHATWHGLVVPHASVAGTSKLVPATGFQSVAVAGCFQPAKTRAERAFHPGGAWDRRPPAHASYREGPNFSVFTASLMAPGFTLGLSCANG
jgi:hypothetical protein